MYNAKVVPVAAMSLLIMGFATVQSKADTIEQLPVSSPLNITVAPNTNIQFYEDGAPTPYEVVVQGNPTPFTFTGNEVTGATKDPGGAAFTSFFDVFVDISLPGTYPYQICPTSGCTSSNVIATGTITVTPLPAALPLFATGLGALGLIGWRRKKKAAA